MQLDESDFLLVIYICCSLKAYERPLRLESNAMIDQQVNNLVPGLSVSFGSDSVL